MTEQQNRTGIPTHLLVSERSLLCLFRAALQAYDFRAFYLPMGWLPLSQTLPSWKNLVELLCSVAANPLPEIEIAEMSEAESTYYCLWMAVRRPESGEGEFLSTALRSLESQIAGLFPVAGDSPGFPVPQPEEGELEAIWRPFVGDPDWIITRSQVVLSADPAEIAEAVRFAVAQVLQICERLKTDCCIFESEEIAAKKRDIWLNSCLSLISRAWPILKAPEDFALLEEVLCGISSSDMLLGTAQRGIFGMQGYAAFLEPRLTELLKGETPRGKDTEYTPAWYPGDDDDIPEERELDCLLWDCLCAIVDSPLDQPADPAVSAEENAG